IGALGLGAVAAGGVLAGVDACALAGAGAVEVAEGGVWHPLGIGGGLDAPRAGEAVDDVEDVVVGAAHVLGWSVGDGIGQFAGLAQRVTGDVEDVAVVGSDDDEGFAEIDRLNCSADGAIELLGLGEGAPGVAGVVGVIDPAALDEEEVAGAGGPIRRRGA